MRAVSALLLAPGTDSNLSGTGVMSGHGPGLADVGRPVAGSRIVACFRVDPENAASILESGPTRCLDVSDFG